MGRKSEVENYLLLDINDITNVCGKITTKELLERANIKIGSLYLWLTNVGILDGKYYVVEDI